MTRESPLARAWHWNQYRLSNLVALLREEYWGSGLIQINDSSSWVRYSGQVIRIILIPLEATTRPMLQGYARSTLLHG
jgi:hypothetical protein